MFARGILECDSVGMKDNVFELKIESFAFGGKAVGRREDGKVCFVRGAAPGETALVRPLSEKEAHCDAALVEILKASKKRVAPFCPLATLPEGKGLVKPQFCPGCSYQHVPYKDELAAKREQLKDFLTRWLESDKAVTASVGAPRREGWRNKLVLGCGEIDGRVVAGYRAEDNKTLLEIRSCPLAHPQIGELLASESAKPGFDRTLRRDMRLTFRRTQRDGAVFWRNEPKASDGWLKESLPQGDFLVPRGSFFQVNVDVASELLRRFGSIVEKAKPETVVDLYCGVGVFSATAAKAGAGKVLGCELDRASVAAAKRNAELLNLPQCSFSAGDSGRFLLEQARGGVSANSLLLVDPPRGGMDQRALAAVEKLRPKTLVYVSCSADGLCRDLKRLLRSGYELRSASVFDMFPSTAHFETMAVLELP